MDIHILTDYFLEYGVIFIFLIVFLEYMNLPGFPSGVIMPLAGIWASRGEINFLTVMITSVLAGVAGSWILYVIGRLGGGKLLEGYFKKFPKHRDVVEDKIAFLRDRGCYGIFISKLIPVARTIIPIPAGMIKMNFYKYTISSCLGILIWNFMFVGAGYFFSEKVISTWN